MDLQIAVMVKVSAKMKSIIAITELVVEQNQIEEFSFRGVDRKPIAVIVKAIGWKSGWLNWWYHQEGIFVVAVGWSLAS